MYNIKIIGRGICLPEKVVWSADLEKENNWPENYILEKHGVKKRHWVTKEHNSTLGAKALANALENAGLNFNELDLLIYASVSYDCPIPTTGCAIQQVGGWEDSGVPCIDVNSSCISFMNAMEVAGALMLSNSYKKIAIVSSEIASRSLHPEAEECYCLFGDGAAAFIMEPSLNSGISYTKFKTYSAGYEYTGIRGGGNFLHPAGEEFKTSDAYFHMEGRKAMLFTIRHLTDFIAEIESELNRSVSDFNYIVPHQPSKQSMDYFINKYNIHKNQMHNILMDYGNCVAASIPIALYDAIEKGKVKRGDEVLMLGTAAGITLGALVFKY